MTRKLCPTLLTEKENDRRNDNSVLPYIVNFCDRAKIDDSFYDIIRKDLTAV